MLFPQILNGRLVDENGIIYAPAFYNYISAWTTNDALAYAASQADFYPMPKEWIHLPGDRDEKGVYSTYNYFIS